MSEVALPFSKRLDDRLNPILVKEVRQSLRGRFFRWMFGLTLLATTFIGLFVVTISADAMGNTRIGQEFFMVIYGCMGAAVLVFVPFSAFLSTSSEWDENTHDLLVLSNLGPGQIVSGKLFSALIQALLYYSTFTPFLVAAFLLNGLDLLVALVVLVCSAATCLAFSLIGIAVAGLAHARALRGILMALFGAGLTIAWGISIGMVGSLVYNSNELRSNHGQIAAGVYFMTALLTGGVAAVIAMARFAHEEENRSTPLRVLSLVVLVVAVGWAVWIHAMAGDAEVSWVLQLVAAHPLLLMWVFFLSEPEELGRRAARFAAERPRLALCSMPLLPGGGRGVLLFGLHALLAVGSALALNLFWGSTRDDTLEAVAIVAWFYAYSFAFVALPAGLVSLFWKGGTARVFLRVGLVIAWPLLHFLPVLFGLLFGIQRWAQWKHPLNAYWVAIELEGSGSAGALFPAMLLITLIGLLALGLNVPRVLRGIRELLAARRSRRAVRVEA
ncbi:MAG: hypothetical protein ABL998_14875 [Planctomycetota bacterium]